MKFSLKNKLLLAAICPLVILGMVVIIITSTNVRNSIRDEIKDSLRATAMATLAAYEQNSGDYYEASNGDIWKGGYNISKSETFVDGIKENTGIDVTFFYGDRRVVTSAVDEDGRRITGSPAGDVIKEIVLDNGSEYFSENVSIDGVVTYGYFIPVFQNQSDNNPVGIIFAGTGKEQKDSVITSILGIITGSVAAVILLGAIAVYIISGGITNAVNRNITILEKVAYGDINVTVEDRYLRRNDEVGHLARSVNELKSVLSNMVININDNADNLIGASGRLNETAQGTIAAFHNIEGAVGIISESSTRQAEQTENASENVNKMGELISDTAAQVTRLNSNADEMRNTSVMASDNIKELIDINREVSEAMVHIKNLTNSTNESVKKISEATNIITAIAEETNLLSLNASIEAARAGDAGRGFAVVADQIQKLAIQSNDASAQIEDVIAVLTGESDLAVETMEKIEDIVSQQNNTMDVTRGTMQEVIRSIEESLESISDIGNKTKELENAREEIITAVEKLSDEAVKNALEMKNTYTSVTEISESFNEVLNSSENFKNVADILAQSLGNFAKRV